MGSKWTEAEALIQRLRDTIAQNPSLEMAGLLRECADTLGAQEEIIDDLVRQTEADTRIREDRDAWKREALRLRGSEEVPLIRGF